MTLSSSYTEGASFTTTVVQCIHGVTIEVGSADRCERCDDERWQDWHSHFLDWWEREHGHRYPVHGYGDLELRRAFEHRF